MKFNSQTKLYVVVAALCSSLFVACDDDDDEEVIDKPSAEALKIMQSDEYAFQIVCAGLFNTYDSLYTTPAVGEALDETQPTVYATGVADEAVARSFFDNLCTVADRCTSLTDGSIQYDLGTYGNLCYRPSGENGALASIDVNLHEVTSLTRLDFISQDLWPNNDVSPFELGDIVKDNIFGYTWVCVQEYGAGLPALFISFVRPGSPEIHTTSAERLRQCASYEALKGWYDLIHSGRSRFTVGTKEYERLSNIDSSIADAVKVDNDNHQMYYSGARIEKLDLNLDLPLGLMFLEMGGAVYHVVAMSNKCGVPVAEDLQFVCSKDSVKKVHLADYLTPRELANIIKSDESEQAADVEASEEGEAQSAGSEYYLVMNELHTRYAASLIADGGEEVLDYLFAFQYHTGTIQYGGKTWNIKQQMINKTAQSISLQGTLAIRMLFTKVEI